jgi:hypothetical protein
MAQTNTPSGALDRELALAEASHFMITRCVPILERLSGIVTDAAFTWPGEIHSRGCERQGEPKVCGDVSR